MPFDNVSKLISDEFMRRIGPNEGELARRPHVDLETEREFAVKSGFLDENGIQEISTASINAPDAEISTL